MIESSASLKDAMALIEANRHRSLIVVSPQGTVVGTISDGDIRKALLSDRLLVAPINEAMNTNFIALQKDQMDQAERIFRETHIFLIPIIDEQARLLDILEAY
jgi:CBS domain-containing protein